MKLILAIYDYFAQHRPMLWGSLLLVCVVLAGLSATISFSEDISDFLPLDARNQRAMQLYQEFSDAERIMIVFEDTTANISRLLDAVDDYQTRYLSMGDSMPSLTTQVDMQQYLDGIDWVYRNIPHFLTADDYARMDSLLAHPDYIPTQLQADKQQLLLPLSSFAVSRIQADPLNLFSPVLQRLKGFMPVSDHFTSTDGYMMSADGRFAFAYITTPYGASETQHNALLVQQLDDIAHATMSANMGIGVRLLGAPVIAVGNAQQIKRDSIMAIGLAMLLIILLLLFTFRHPKEILYVLLTVTFGMLFGIAVVAVVCHSVSLIVIGIGTIIIGIAVNYPLHVVVHRRYTQDTRTNIKEVVSPLVIGNITTMAAFLTLLPLRAVALRDLGIFAAAMLVGTILFSVIYLPHMLPAQKQFAEYQRPILPFLSKYSLHNSRLAMIAIGIITLVLVFFCPSVSFDSNLSNINYMTTQQRNDIAYFASLTGGSSSNHTAYIVYEGTDWSDLAAQSEQLQPTLDAWLADSLITACHSAVSYLPSLPTQQQRLQRWQQFCTQHSDQLTAQITAVSSHLGFSANAFDGFFSTLNTAYTPRDFAYFQSFAELFFHSYYHISSASDNMLLVDKLSVPVANEQTVLSRLSTHHTAFTIEQVNSQITSSLSENFDYIGIACSLIVFIFLWCSFRNLWLAVVAFVPMAISWIWILGLMHLFGIQFNIINIILATFVFGQGDDYTIFMVEGLEYERKTGKTILPQFRSEILLSALIMLIGIGVLVFAKHPAMHSLGAVTLIGMTSVVLMAFTIPPLLFAVKRSLGKRGTGKHRARK